jgi:hypothetical protein
MLECIVNFIAKCKLSEFAVGFCHSKKMYKVTNFFCDRTNVRSKLLLLGHLPNLVGHCPMSDSNLQPCLYVQGDARYDKYTYGMLTIDRLSPDLYPVENYLVPSGIWAPSDYHLVLGKPPSGATSGKDLGPITI